MKQVLKYGTGALTVELPDDAVVIEPEQLAGLSDERSAFLDALENPFQSLPLSQIVGPETTVAVVFSDRTRPIPNHRIIPWLLDHLSCSPDNVTLINATGMHRVSPPDELRQMLTGTVTTRYRVVNHVATDPSTMTSVDPNGPQKHILLNREFMEADVKILTGFIEPHMFAGFSGGPKSVLPGVAGAAAILPNHSAEMIGHPSSTWGITEGNPIWEEMCRVAELADVSFIVNVSLNSDRELTGVFAGSLKAAHSAGVEFVKAHSMRPVEKPFDVVITTNAGYPLDLNLYQTVKCISAARQIVRKGGAIIAAAECREGIPDFGNYKELLHAYESPEELLNAINGFSHHRMDQWEAQIQAMAQAHAEVFLYSTLAEEEVRRAHIEPISSIEDCLQKLQARSQDYRRIAVLPRGPETIPYLSQI